jgi:hypothetical protein
MKKERERNRNSKNREIIMTKRSSILVENRIRSIVTKKDKEIKSIKNIKDTKSMRNNKKDINIMQKTYKNKNKDQIL